MPRKYYIPYCDIDTHGTYGLPCQYNDPIGIITSQAHTNTPITSLLTCSDGQKFKHFIQTARTWSV